MKKKKISINIDKVYTKKGDKGTTSIIGENFVSKSDPRIVCYGEVDELNSSIGFCFALIQECDQMKDEKISESIKSIQNDLFNLGTMLAISNSIDTKEYPSIDGENIKFLENLIDLYNEKLPPLKSFVLPSGSTIGAYFHVCRTICRRVERSCVSLSRLDEINPDIIKYLNRLSDLLFVWARWSNKRLDKIENVWSI
tara:strand:+ start:1172 stop:1762 length:591 start_codon:yes stop_codon:yes gene_type:complete